MDHVGLPVLFNFLEGIPLKLWNMSERVDKGIQVVQGLKDAKQPSSDSDDVTFC